MHIAFVNRWFPPETSGGGVASHNYNIAKAIAQLGHKVTIIAHRPKPETPAYSERDGLHIYRVSVLDTTRLKRVPFVGTQYRFLQSVLYSRAVCNRLYQLHQKDPIDVAEFAEVNAEALFWRPKMSTSLVIRCHTPTFVLKNYYLKSEVPFGTRAFEWAERRIIRNAKHLTAPSQDMANMISIHAPAPLSKIQVIPNAVEIFPDIQPGAQANTSGFINILFVGRFERVKGIDLLLETIPEVAKKSAIARFIIVGLDRVRDDHETYKTYILRTMGEYIERGQLDLKGFVSDAELDALYRSADICLVPSFLYESFSMTCAQAMAYGKPVITTNTGGIPETVGETGITINPNKEELAAAILHLIEDPKLRESLGKAAYQRVLENFAASVVAKQTIAYYGTLL